MKLSFSTLGCPSWDLDHILRSAADLGFQGLEIRGLQADLDVSRRPEFTTQASLTRRKLEERGIAIVCFSSSVLLSEPDPSRRGDSLDELKRYAGLCVTFGTPFIRIFGGKIGSVSREAALETAAATLRTMAGVVLGTEVRILVETHDDWMRAPDMKALMEAAGTGAAGLLWDVNHPFMFVGEPPADTWRETGPWIRHTHWKDSIRSPKTKHGFEPCLMGAGEVPHREIHRVLREGGYTGYLSLEWEKRWHPEIPGPDVAFPQYVEYMKRSVGVPEDRG